MVQPTLLSRADLESALVELAERLAADGAPLSIRVIGGAALSLGHVPDRRATTDVDAVVHGDDALLRGHIGDIAVRRGWHADWLSTAAVQFLPFAGDPEWTELVARNDVHILIAPADMLLAMKLNAARGRRDRNDITSLLGLCGVSTVPEAEAIFERYYPGESMKERALDQLVLELCS